MSEMFDCVVDKLYHYPDGRMREEKKRELLARGQTEDDIRALEDDVRERIRNREIYKGSQAPRTTVRDRIIERAGLTTEEALSGGYLSLDDLIDTQDEERPIVTVRRIDPDLPDEEF